MARTRPNCCETLAEVLAGPGGGADPTLFVADDDTGNGGDLMMVIAMVDTPGGLGLIDHPVAHCPFCGADVRRTRDPIN